MAQPHDGQPEHRSEHGAEPHRTEPDTVPLAPDPTRSDPAASAGPQTDDPAADQPLVQDPHEPVGEPDPLPVRVPAAEKERRGLPTLGLGRRLRVLAGVDERLMAYVPQEKAWYTSLGGVVLGTATIAAFSMWFAITQALGVTSYWAILAVLVWFFFILSVDRWLVSGRLTGDLRKRVPVLMMRVAMAVLFGIIIAEPLVLRVFQTAVEKYIQDERTQALADLAGRLKNCNPAPTTADAKPPQGCTSTDVLSFPTTPAATLKQLASMRSDADKLQATVDADSKKLADLNELARRECNGTTGAGLTGRVGEGPNCHRLRGEADTYARTHQLGPNNARLTAMRTQITALEATAQQNQAAFEVERDKLIVARVADARSHQGRIGLLERLGALHALAATNLTLGLGIWAVRLFFILVDCMPILVKFVGGSTTYDRLVGIRLAYAERTFEDDLAHEMDERAAVFRKRRAEIDLEVLEHKAELHDRLEAAADLLGGGVRSRY
ncbi:DUF4407 domain-containing protein [Hamadaea tsunoensis]|uniref:DUF4407 domain-containing protein n=1 Tax=Hamadaea tsunoensis TaxID=53368 RepID=UPI000406AF78|nr:DUF4407 domain-containing protein [Hamadaea tsunoensis]